MTLDTEAASKRTNLSCVLVRLEADDGAVGTGFTAITEEEIVAAAIDQVAAPAVIGMDPMAGQNEGLASRFVDFFVANAVDIAQPNVAITGGLTQCLRIAGAAQAFNVAIANGGAWPFHNMHLHAGLSHGGFVEYHRSAVLLYKQIYRGLPAAHDGWLEPGEAPGFGIEPDWDAVAELARRPLSRGAGKA
ncbi:MAG: hypothetical protein LT106_11460 [Burkholderiaceae bacterium]|nr:hypothetical protein [Burkholderiaceae bacterium]